jgi:hypothetical protein
MDEVFDLFGNPVRPGRGQKGRPRFEATEKDRNKIKLLLAVGWSGQRIANAIGVSLATLKRYFRAELKVRDLVRDQLEARRLELAYDAASTGNVGAMRQLDRVIERLDREGLDKRLREAQDGDEPDEEALQPKRKLGKKEAAEEAAKTIGQDDNWGSDLLPGVH